MNLSETMSVWGKLVAPWAEYVARTVWSGTKTNRVSSIPTRLKGRFASTRSCSSKAQTCLSWLRKENSA